MAMAQMQSVTPYEDATPLLNNPAALQQRAAEQGYLFFKGLLPSQPILHLRRLILDRCQARDWLAADSETMDGIPREGFSIVEGNDPEWLALYREILAMRDFHALAMHPAILGALTTLFGEQAIAHSRNIARIMFPRTEETTTPPHQDHFYIGGTQDTWTVWFPLGDCPKELGGLAIVQGSHREGYLDVQPGRGAGGHQVQVPEDATWAWDEMRCGDVLMLHSLCIHQGRDNVSGDRLRLSVDYRYQPISHPIRRDSMEPHMGGFGESWEDLYAEWPGNDPLRYFWKQWDLNYVDQE
jgi:hypothetical protein